MSDLFWTILVLVLVVIALVSLVFLVAVWILRKKYTRERFAFHAILVLSSAFVLSITTLQQSPWETILVAVCKALEIQYVSPARSGFELLFMLALFAILALVIQQVHANWDGGISVEHRKRMLQHEPSGLLSEGLNEFRRVRRWQAPREIYTPLDRRKLPSALAVPTESLAWRDQACDLVCLGDRNYEFDRDHGWDEKLQSWFGRNKRTGVMVVLRCSHDDLRAEELDLSQA